MFTVKISPTWKLGADELGAVHTGTLLTLLAAIQEHGGIAQAARSVGLSYRTAWGQIQRAQAAFGFPLIDAGRGRGSTLTAFGEKLIWADRRIAARLSPILESLSSELENELDRALPRVPQALRLHASHGFAVAALADHLGAAHIPLELRYRNSFEAVAALSSSECDLAGLHVPIGEFEAAAVQRYRRWLNPASHQLVELATRNQGLFVLPGNPKRIRGIADLRRPDVRFVNRPEGSGTRMLAELLLDKAGIRHDEVSGFENTELTHAAVAAFIASGMADVGIGVETAAERFGLHFLPLLRERYFFAMSRSASAQPAMKQALGLLRSAPVRASIAALKGYDAGRTGRVLELGVAFESW